jgi:hypothetical protein
MAARARRAQASIDAMQSRPLQVLFVLALAANALAGAASAQVRDLLPSRSHHPARAHVKPLANGDFARSVQTNVVYRVVGGAPLRIANCKPFGRSCGRARVVDQSLLIDLRGYPENGTFVRAAETGRIYRVAGGSPLLVTACKPLGGCNGAITVDKGAIAWLKGSNHSPENGTFLQVPGRRPVYEMLGGAPIRIHRFDLFPRSRKRVYVNQSAIDTLERHRSFPKSVTYLRAADTLRAYKIEGGKLVQIDYCARSGCGISPNIDQAAVDRLTQHGSVQKHRRIVGDLLILLAAGALFAGFTVAGVFRPLVAAGGLLAVFLLTEASRYTFDPLLHLENAYPGRLLGGFTIYSYDIVAAAFLTVAAYQLIRHGFRNYALALVIALLVLVAVHIGRGIATFGLQGAVNSGRPLVYVLSSVAFAGTVRRSWSVRVWQLFAATCPLLIAIAVGYYVRYGFHAPTDLVMQNGTSVSARVINGGSAMLILESIVILSVLHWPSRRSGFVLAALLTAGVIALQIRTIWAIGIGILLVAVVARLSERTERSRVRLTRTVGGAFVVATLAVISFLKSGALIRDVQTAVRPTGTFGWRITGWKDLLMMHHSLKEIVTGMPSGPIWTRTVNGVTTDVLPHDFYVELFVRLGVLGILALIALYLSIWRGRAAIASKLGLTPLVVGLILLIQLMYFISYSPDLLQGLILGMFIAALPATALRRSRDPAGEAGGEKPVGLVDAR